MLTHFGTRMRLPQHGCPSVIERCIVTDIWYVRSKKVALNGMKTCFEVLFSTSIVGQDILCFKTTNHNAIPLGFHFESIR